MAMTMVWRISDSLGGRTMAERLGAVDDLAPFAQDDDGAVVHGVMKSRARQDQAIEQGDGDAGVDAVAQGAEHAAGGGAVEVERIAHPRVDGGDDERLSAVF